MLVCVCTTSLVQCALLLKLSGIVKLQYTTYVLKQVLYETSILHDRTTIPYKSLKGETFGKFGTCNLPQSPYPKNPLKIGSGYSAQVRLRFINIPCAVA